MPSCSGAHGVSGSDESNTGTLVHVDTAQDQLSELSASQVNPPCHVFSDDWAFWLEVLHPQHGTKFKPRDGTKFKPRDTDSL